MAAGRSPSKQMKTLVRAEKLTQIAFILPVSLVVGWVLGAGLDKWLHQSWIYLVGILLGIAAGFVQIFKMVTAPSTFADTAPDPLAPKGRGFEDEKNGEDAGQWKN